mmetsp:Transcript_1624/g.2421  ORF Transcript_1624/g.2421 Transcript_1624/m.2421 type:complete len:345 (-) Transcript_1624:40-1074(-)|eukprot:scaffold7059_cov118-Skeletonema_dohrnii-CCMP3373.AAC.3
MEMTNRLKRRVTRRRQSSSRAKIILAIFALFIFVIGTRTIGLVSDEQERQFVHLRGGSNSKKKSLVWVHSDSQAFNDRSLASQATHLIIVAGHSVLISGDVENAAHDDSVWWLYDYQRNRGLPQAIVSHIQAGIKLALEDEKSLLVFSGGETRSQTGPETEGGSYFRVADALHLWHGRDVFSDGETAAINEASTVRARTTTEEYATDSFENLLFSICRFREVTGAYPTKISVVSFTFKKQRFETLHAGALQWSVNRFHYVGVDPPASTGFNLKISSEGERKNSLVPFQTDPYGCHTDILQQKRKERNPYQRTAPYPLTCPEMKELLKWCGPDLISKSQVPWGTM